jgi:hypothetical protein
VSARVALRRLEALGRRRAETEASIAAVVGMARATGAPWSAIGTALGVSAQAPQQRYGPRPGGCGAGQQGSLSSSGHQARLRTPGTIGATTGKGRRK